ncbi:MAG TPA: proteinase inhibitor I4 serpin, partial [Candidatus Marinimicrobia bacterium]|nr:proteinase inhibitor I4 serpin [Candidatus Neomarinimicrobiota bacterium]
CNIDIVISIIIIISLISINCSDIFKNPDTDNKLGIIRNLTYSEVELKESSNQFGLKLFGKIVETEQDKNIFISPLSISMALGMTYNGAAGATLEAMHETLEYGDLTIQEVNESYQSLIELLTELDPEVIFDIANSIWYREGFPVENDFLTTNQDYFDAVVRALDFNRSDAVDIINAWVDENTNGKIEEIVDSPIDPLTIMFLINAIYFKGTWTYEFKEENTVTEPFTLADGSIADCQMMSHKCDHNYFENEQFQAIDLPYGDAGFSMTILLPKPEVNIDSLTAQLNNETWNSWLGSFSEREVNLFLPKFKLEYEILLNDILSALGMSIAFDPGQADFTKINTNGNLYISKVKHKTFVKVNEEGTEAAAVTSVEISRTSVGETGIIMRVNHPFIFAIRENHSGTILFIGKIVEPEWED